MANEEGAVVVGDGDHQRAAQADHEVGHGQAEEEGVHGMEERWVPQHHGDDQAVVEDRQQRVDEHEEGEHAVAHPREDGGHRRHQLGRRCRREKRRRSGGAPQPAVAVHGADQVKLLVPQSEPLGSSHRGASPQILSLLIPVQPAGGSSSSHFPGCHVEQLFDGGGWCNMELFPNTIWED